MRGLSQLVTRTLFVFFVLCVFGYGLFVSRDYFQGPRITLAPFPPRETVEAALTITGSVSDAEDLTLNGAQVFYTSTHTFNERRLLVPGENRFIMSARDTFNHTEEISFSVYYSPPPPHQMEGSAETSLPTPVEIPIKK